MRIYADRLTSVRTHTIIIYIYTAYHYIVIYLYIYTTNSIDGGSNLCIIYLLLCIVHRGSGIVRVVDRRRSIIVL